MTSYQASQQYPRQTRDRGSGSGVGWMILAVFLGIAVAVLAIVSVVLVRVADDARDEAAIAAGTTDHSAHADSNVSLPLQSFAGQTGENAEELAMAHPATDAALPAAPVGDLVKVQMTLKDMVVEIAPGVKYNTWAFDGHGAPGPVVHVREGQMVEMTLTNGGAIPHSIDFHAARIAPNVAFRDVAPGESITFRFRASDPGIYMYHCGTKPVLAHIANGMYGAIIVEPRAAASARRQRVRPRRQRVVPDERRRVRARLARHGQGSLDACPTGSTFNGYANQYVTHPLTADPGETTRFWVVAAGPTNNVNFHVVGAILDRAWINSDVTQFQRNVQTVDRPRRRRCRLRREGRRGRALPVRLPRLRGRRPRPGRSPQGRQPQGHVDPLGALRSFPARIGICPDGSRYADREPSGKRTRRRQMTTILERTPPGRRPRAQRRRRCARPSCTTSIGRSSSKRSRSRLQGQVRSSSGSRPRASAIRTSMPRTATGRSSRRRPSRPDTRASGSSRRSDPA